MKRKSKLYNEILHLLHNPPIEVIEGVFVRKFQSPKEDNARDMAEVIEKFIKRRCSYI